MDDFKGQVVGAQVGTAFVDALNKKGIFGSPHLRFDRRHHARRRARPHQAGFADQPIVAYQIEHGVNRQVRLVPEYQSVVKGQVCFIVRKGDTATLATQRRDPENEGRRHAADPAEVA